MKINSLISKILILSLFACNMSIFAEQKYNPYTRQWETTSPDAGLNYNPYSRGYEYTSERNNR